MFETQEARWERKQREISELSFNYSPVEWELAAGRKLWSCHFLSTLLLGAFTWFETATQTLAVLGGAVAA